MMGKQRHTLYGDTRSLSSITSGGGTQKCSGSSRLNLDRFRQAEVATQELSAARCRGAANTHRAGGRPRAPFSPWGAHQGAEDAYQRPRDMNQGPLGGTSTRLPPPPTEGAPGGRDALSTFLRTLLHAPKSITSRSHQAATGGGIYAAGASPPITNTEKNHKGEERGSGGWSGTEDRATREGRGQSPPALTAEHTAVPAWGRAEAVGKRSGGSGPCAAGGGARRRRRAWGRAARPRQGTADRSGRGMGHPGSSVVTRKK